MSNLVLSADVLYEMFANGYRNLCRGEAKVNDLNVFPVPDGDTGTNMLKTLSGGIGAKVSEGEAFGDWMKRFSKSVLLSARGNSGVILSQFIRGLSLYANGKDALRLCEVHLFLKSGVESAYSAVSSPTEGTMLTVLRESTEAMENKNNSESFEECFGFVLEEMKKSLAHTPELLPVLKEAGVVDSGGMGMIYIFEGMLAYLSGEIIEQDSVREEPDIPVAKAFGPDSVLEYGYCTEFVLQLMNYKTNIASFSIRNMISYLESVGDSIVAVLDEDIVKVHVHTFTPEKVLSFARNYGEFVTVKIENMSVQHNEISANETKETEEAKYAVVAVASGDGIKDYFSQIGAQRIIDGGQTQNPSAAEFIEAFESVRAKHIVVLPDNSNIIMTAKQAAEMYDKADVRVLPAKSIAQGYSALSMMNTWADDIDAFVEDMMTGINGTSSGSVTRAVHDACINGVSVKEGMFMGIADGEILSSSDDKIDATLKMLSALPGIEDKAVVTIFYGEGVTEAEAESLIEAIETGFPQLECGAISGGQKLYDFYMAIE